MYSFFFKQDEFELTDFEDYNDDDGDIFSDPVSASGVCVYPAACRVIYSYQVGIFFHLHKVIASQDTQMMLWETSKSGLLRFQQNV